MRREQVMQARQRRVETCQRLMRTSAGHLAESSTALTIMRAWHRLDELWPRVAMTLDLHHISGLRVHVVATVLGRSLQTSALDLRLGHAWLARAIERERGS
jgi:hypothetical protein